MSYIIISLINFFFKYNQVKLDVYEIVKLSFFLVNLEVKRPKTKYNNKEIAWRIRHYILEYIQNLDKVFANLERSTVIIASGKS